MRNEARRRGWCPDLMKVHLRFNSLLLIGFCLTTFCVDSYASAENNGGNDLLEAEQLLSNLGYRILKVDGVADRSTYHAIVAFQKVEGLERTGKISSGFLESLRFAQRPAARFHDVGAHIEIDISRQVLFVTDDHETVV